MKSHASGEMASTRPVTGFLPEMLAELEAGGDAMRYVNSQRSNCVECHAKLRHYLIDLQLDAEADLEDI